MEIANMFFFNLVWLIIKISVAGTVGIIILSLAYAVIRGVVEFLHERESRKKE